MDAELARTRILERYTLRVQQRMGEYVARLASIDASPAPSTRVARAIAVMGGHARTGVPVRQLIDLNELLNASASPHP
ncbi:MAG TPA: hypothetical protein VIL86_13375 [Tepidisphaeraceae bacterium]|jgi:hypothetical protein